MNRAVFLDRDGVVNEIIYHEELGIIDTPFTREQFKLLPNVGESIKILNQTDFKVIITSNQPGIAKGHLSMETFNYICEKMRLDLAKKYALLDGEYYCFHHPEAKNEMYKMNCGCRKPKSGLLLKAATDLDINLSESWMVGDSLTDVIAGKTAECKTILIGNMKCDLCRLMDDMCAKPDYIVSNLLEATDIIKKES